MRNVLSIIILLTIMVGSGLTQPPTTIWTQNISGEYSQNLNSMDLAYYGGYVAVGTQVMSINGDTSHIAFMQFNEDGNVQWQNNVQPGNICYGAHIRRNWDNTTYIIAGSSRPSYSNYSTLHLIKINDQGNIQWIGNYGSGQLGQEADVACAYSGEYILLGNVYSPNQFIRLFKVSQSGAEIWNKTIGGYYSRGKSIIEAFDPGFYIAGSIFSFPHMSNDFYLLKVNANGDTLWTKSWGDSGSYEEYVDIAKTNDGKLIAVGNRWLNGQNESVLVKYDLEGNILWTREIGAYEDYYANSVVQDDDGGYLIAASINSMAGTLPVMIKTNANGFVRWIASAYGNGYFADAVPGNFPGGYVAVGGQTQFIYTNMYLAKMNSDPSVPVSVVPFAANDITLPFTGGQFEFDLTVTNESSYLQYFDIWSVIELPNVGEVTTFVAPNRTLTGMGSLSRTLSQYVPSSAPPGFYTYNIYIGNYPWEIYYYDSFSFAKSGTTGDGGWEDNNWLCSGWSDAGQYMTIVLPATVSLSNSPNPFNPSTTINYALPNSGNTILRVYDISGRQVAELVNGWREAGTHSVTFDGSTLSSGIYLCHIQSGSHTATLKLMLVK